MRRSGMEEVRRCGMANFTILSDQPFEDYILFLEETMQILSSEKVQGLAVVALLEGPDESGADVLTGYYNMSLRDKQAAASQILADVTDGIVRANIRRYLEEMELDPSQKIFKMSSGMMAKLKIALTLSRDARLIMLDEPLNGIDLITREKIVEAVTNSFSPGKTFVLSSHLVEELEKIIHHAFFIRNGELVLEGSLDDLHREQGKTIVDLYKEIYA